MITVKTMWAAIDQAASRCDEASRSIGHVDDGSSAREAATLRAAAAWMANANLWMWIREREAMRGQTPLSQAVNVQLKMMDQIIALEAQVAVLRRVAIAAQHYAANYCLDEAEDAETCSREQHKAAKELCDALAGGKP